MSTPYNDGMLGDKLFKDIPTDWQLSQRKLKFMLDEMGIKYRKICSITGKDPGLITRWLNAKAEIPKEDQIKIEAYFKKLLSGKFKI